METAIVLFTRDLRVRDNPALTLACARARQVVPLFVIDPALKVPPNRARFLAESVAVLRGELRKRGGELVIRHGEPVAEAIRLAERTAGQAVFVAGDVSRYAALRQERLERECARHRLALEVTPGRAVVPPGELRPAGRPAAVTTGSSPRTGGCGGTPPGGSRAWRRPPSGSRAGSRRATRRLWTRTSPGAWRQAASGRAGNCCGPGWTARSAATATAGTTWPTPGHPG
ncbi:MAG TPA: deoxyribodipyrimidine photo-lyase [Streptosporangiaceae bacterium]